MQYVYRIFPGSATFGKNAVRFMTEIFREAAVSPKRIVILYSNDLFGKTQTESFMAAQKAANPGFDVVEVLSGELPADVLAMSLAEAGLRNGDVLHIGDAYLDIAGNGVNDSLKCNPWSGK